MKHLRVFQSTDYDAFAGATKHGDKEPLICSDDPRFMLIVSGGDAPGHLPQIYIQVHAYEDPECFMFCYMECHPSENWNGLVDLGEWICEGLKSDTPGTWSLVNALIEAQDN